MGAVGAIHPSRNPSQIASRVPRAHCTQQQSRVPRRESRSRFFFFQSTVVNRTALITSSHVSSIAQIKHLSYLNAVIQETLRVRPPTPVTSRSAKGDSHVDGVFVPKDTQIMIPIRTVNVSQASQLPVKAIQELTVSYLSILKSCSSTRQSGARTRLSSSQSGGWTRQHSTTQRFRC